MYRSGGASLGHIHEARVLAQALDMEVDGRERVLPIVRDMAVELFILAFFDILWPARPKRAHRIQRLFFPPNA